jgi:WD40 repeat protein/uncharacterized caspase-like protein
MKRETIHARVLTAICLAVVALFCPAIKAQVAVAQPQHKQTAVLYVQTGHTSLVYSVAFSPDGKTLASGSGDRSIKLWSVETGQELRTLSGETKDVRTVAFSPDGKILASGSDNYTVKLWSVETGRELITITGHQFPVSSVAFSPDGKIVVSGSEDGTIKLWNAETGKELKTLSGHTDFVRSVAFSPDGKTLASGSGDKTVKVWDAEIGQEIRTLAGHTKNVSSIAFSPGGETLASASWDNTIKFWNAKTGKELRTLDKHSDYVHSITFLPDGKTLASGSADKTIKLWDVETGRELRTLEGQGESVWFVASSPDSKTLAAGSSDGAIKLWSAETGRQLRMLKGHAESVESAVFSPNGKSLAAEGGVFDKTIKLWNLETGRELRTLAGHTDNIYSLAFSQDGKTLATAGGYHDKRIKLWKTETGQELKTLPGHSEVTYSLVFSPDGKILASTSSDKTIKVWNADTGQLIKSFDEGDANTRREVSSFVPDFERRRDETTTRDGRFQVKVRDKSNLDLYEVKTGKLLASLIAFDRGDWAVVTPGGLFDGSPNAWRLLSWRLSDKLHDIAPVEAFFKEFYRPGLLQDIFAGRNIENPTRDISTIDIRQPEVKVTTANLNQTTSNVTARQLTINVEVKDAPANERRRTSAGAKDVRLFRNGSLVKSWRGDILGGKESVTLTATVPITAGDNTFTAYAFNNENVKSPDGELMVRGAESLKRKGTAYILAIGVNEYSNAQYNLKYAVADARTFSEEIKNQQGKLGQYERVEEVVILDKDATKQNILSALGKLPSKVQPEDAVFVYFAGHGTAQANRFYLIPHDLGYAGPRTSIDEAGLRELLRHSISDRELEDAFERVDAGQILLVIDACNSGQALEAEEKRRGPMNSKGLAQLAYEKGMYILTAAQSFQAAQEASQLGHGLLTYALVNEGLRQAVADREPKDGTILVREWLDYATSRVPEMQLDKMKAARDLFFVEEERGLNLNVEKRSGQRPRVFYRRELESQPLIVAKP